MPKYSKHFNKNARVKKGYHQNAATAVIGRLKKSVTGMGGSLRQDPETNKGTDDPFKIKIDIEGLVGKDFIKNIGKKP